MLTRLNRLSQQERAIILLLLAMLLLLPPLVYWWARPETPWYVPYLLWSVIIVLTGLSRLGRRDV